MSIPQLPQLASLEPQVTDFLRALEPYRLTVEHGGQYNYYILPPELNFLASIEEDPISPLPEEFTILAAFDSQGLAGRSTLVSVPHMEGTWIREDLRKKSRLGYTLVKEIEKCISMSGRSNLIAFTPDEDKSIESHLSRLGYKRLPVSVWVKYDLDKDQKEIK